MNYVACSKCGKQVSNDVGTDVIVRAFIECPECVVKNKILDRDQLYKEYGEGKCSTEDFNKMLASLEGCIETALTTMTTTSSGIVAGAKYTDNTNAVTIYIDLTEQLSGQSILEAVNSTEVLSRLREIEKKIDHITVNTEKYPRIGPG